GVNTATTNGSGVATSGVFTANATAGGYTVAAMVAGVAAAANFSLTNTPTTLVPTSTSVTSSLNPSAFGQSLTFTATVSSSSGTPRGAVTFKNGSVTLLTVTLTDGVASFTTATLDFGTKSITAVYHGSSSFLGSTSPVLSQVVDKATSTVTLTSSQNPSSLGQPVTFTATVAAQFSGTPTGEVTFKGDNIQRTVTLTDGVASLTTATVDVGTKSITAVYHGSSSFL